MTFIWATRGRTWGFRFLRDGGHADPLPEYEKAFTGAETDCVCQKVGGVIALRFPDPEGRTDRVGRVIPHEFVVTGPDTNGIDSVESGIERIWPLVAEEYARIW